MDTLFASFSVTRVILDPVATWMEASEGVYIGVNCIKYELASRGMGLKLNYYYHLSDILY